MYFGSCILIKNIIIILKKKNDDQHILIYIFTVFKKKTVGIWGRHRK